ncbi:MAG: rod shape-determining protein RodA [Oscillospiraceae bacterium]|nr:rod shape-determining protein RodA [Oscillospiraceae bacterium]
MANSVFIIEKIKGIKDGKQFDVVLFGAVISLTAMGFYILYSVSHTLNTSSQPSFGADSVRAQLIYILVGIVWSLVLSSIDYRYFRIPGYVAYIGTFVLLILVMFMGYGDTDWGSRRWLTLPIIGNFQPAELAKIAFVIVNSSFFERIKTNSAVRMDYIKMISYTALPIFLIWLQGDTGTSVVFFFIFFVMAFICGIKYRFIFAGLATAIAALPVLWIYVLRPYQKMRILTFLNPELDRQGRGWQVIRSKIAIGAGQLYGRNAGSSTASLFSQVPERDTDFIFSVVGEKLGFVGCALFILLVVFLLLRCVYISSKSRDYYGSFMVIGLTAMMAFHFIENIGMSIGLAPVTGIPLPFVSRGGTAMFTNFTALGIILSVSMMREKTHYRENQSNRIINPAIFDE